MTSVTPKTLGLGLAALLAVLILTSLLTGETAFVLPVVLLAAIIGLAVAAVIAVGSGKRRRYGSAQRASADGDDAIPGTQFLPDDGSPLGASDEAHLELGEHDLPPGSTSRPRAGRAG